MKIKTLEELRDIYAQPTERVIRKEITRMDKHVRRFISLSPFFVISSGNEAHHMDASPRGGAPGFVKVIDDSTLLIPDAPGNNRLDTLQNILATSQVGLLFMIPGVDEMLRIHGQAVLSTDEDVLQVFADAARPPKLVIEVSVVGAYLHCAKAVMRSNLWKADHQVDRATLPSMGEMIKDHARLEGPAETHEEMLRRYTDSL